MNEITARSIAALAPISKQPLETRFFPICFSNVLLGNEIVSGVTVDCADGSVNITEKRAGGYATVGISGGSHGSVIPIRVIVLGSLGSVCVQCLRLAVNDPLAELPNSTISTDGGTFDQPPTGRIDGGSLGQVATDSTDGGNL